MPQMITMGGNAEIELIDSMDPFSEGELDDSSSSGYGGSASTVDKGMADCQVSCCQSCRPRRVGEPLPTCLVVRR